MLDLTLTEKQTLVFESDATEILYGGAAGSGKSHLMRVLAVYYALAVPYLQIYLLRRMVKDLMNNHMTGSSGFPNLLQPLVEAKKCRINYTSNEIRFSNGSTIHLCHLNDNAALNSFQGAEIGLLLLDELTHFEDAQYRYLRSRLRLGAGQQYVPENLRGRLPKIIASTNPGGVGHNWVKQAFVDPAKPMDKWVTPEDEGGMLRQYIPAKFTDNPYLDKGYDKQLKGMGSSRLTEAMLDGNWDIASGGYFEDLWNREVHVIPEFIVPSDWIMSRSFDWGSTKPYSVGFWAEASSTPALIDGRERYFPRGTLIRVGEIYGWTGKANVGLKETAATIAGKILEYERARGWKCLVACSPADASIFVRENGPSIADDMARSGVNWVPSDKSAGSRVGGLMSIRARLSNALNSREEAGLYVTRNCLQFIRTIPTIPIDDRKPDDVDTDAEDHVLDETRYRVSFKPKTISTASVVGF